MNEKPLITIVLPALNEEGAIATVIQEIVDAYTRLSIKGEILVINDGSTDGTKQIVEDFQKEYLFIRLINHEKPHGVGPSTWEGFKAAHGELVTCLPADGENDPSEILRYVPLMQHVDMVVPFILNPEVRPRYRLYISRFYKLIINVTFGCLINYMNGCVLYRKSILDVIQPRTSGFFLQTEILIKGIKAGFLYAEVPFAIFPRTAGESKALGFKSLGRVISGYFSTVLAIYYWKDYRASSKKNTITEKRRLAVAARLGS